MKKKPRQKTKQLRKVEISLGDFRNEHMEAVHADIKELDKITMRSWALAHTIAVSNDTRPKK